MVKSGRAARLASTAAGSAETATDQAEDGASFAAQAEASAKRRRTLKAESAASAATAEQGDEEEDEEEDDEVESEEDCEEYAGEGEEEEEEGGAPAGMKSAFRPGIDKVEEGEQLDCDPSTYDMIHKAQVDWPCLSFDIVRDSLGAQRTTYPKTAYIVAGTQAEQVADNRIYMMKWHCLHRTAKEEDEEDDSEEESDSEEEATLEQRSVPHPGGVNRIRAMPQAGHIVATWADTGKLHLWNLDSQRKALDKAGEKAPPTAKPIFTCEAHKEEGFALDFSPHETGRLLSGANDKVVLLWDPVPGGWKVDSANPFSGHTAAVEDVQWKRHGDGAQSVFATCSADKSFRVWDVREKDRNKSVVHVKDAHKSDVNVLSWSPCVGELLVTGADDGSFKIWDTRSIGAGPMANFAWHKKPITTVDWHPTDETTLALASDDNSVSIWDMAVEDDLDGSERPPGGENYPAQLLFLHMGQQEPKELKWHPQLPGVCITTAGSGFNIFKTCNI